MLRSKSLSILAGVAALALMGSGAHADFIATPFNLTIANANLATQGPGPYASVTISGIGAQGTTSSTTFNEFEVTTTGLNNFVFGDGGTFALNLSTGAGAGTLCTTPTHTGCTTPLPTHTVTQTSGNEDGFGSFNFALDDGSGFSSPFSSLTFDFTTANLVTVGGLLTGTSGPGSTGATAAAHMALSSNTGCTGFVGNAGTQGMGTNDNPTDCHAVPAPVIGHGVLVLLAIGGVLCAGKALESLKKHRMQAA